MTISAFRKYVREWKHTKDPVVMLHSLDKLELLPLPLTNTTFTLSAPGAGRCIPTEIITANMKATEWHIVSEVVRITNIPAM